LTAFNPKARSLAGIGSRPNGGQWVVRITATWRFPTVLNELERREQRALQSDYGYRASRPLLTTLRRNVAPVKRLARKLA
jgi:hypothetical protein